MLYLRGISDSFIIIIIVIIYLFIRIISPTTDSIHSVGSSVMHTAKSLHGAPPHTPSSSPMHTHCPISYVCSLQASLTSSLILPIYINCAVVSPPSLPFPAPHPLRQRSCIVDLHLHLHQRTPFPISLSPPSSHLVPHLAHPLRQWSCAVDYVLHLHRLGESVPHQRRQRQDPNGDNVHAPPHGPPDQCHRGHCRRLHIDCAGCECMGGFRRPTSERGGVINASRMC